MAKELTISQKAEIELNRQKALLIRQEKLNKRKLYEISEEKNCEKPRIVRVDNVKVVDSGAGFFINESEEASLTQEDFDFANLIANEPPSLPKDTQPNCDECNKLFNNSYLFHTFNEPICDGCRDKEEKHILITKTDAKKTYLLKDTDLDSRAPPLQFIVKKNPHNSRWGDMKLYLKLQVERRALKVWETEEALENALENQEEKREKLKTKKFKKKMIDLRMNVRSSLYTRASQNHVHEYGDEVYLPDEDEYSKTCKSCNHTYTYDKM